MVRLIILGVGIVAIILFIAWVLRDPIYFQVMGWMTASPI